jgi:hypothetical protein
MREGRLRICDAVVLVGLCAAVVLTAGAMSIGGRMHAKTVMCQQNLRCIGQALNQYVDKYNGGLPSLEKGTVYPYMQHYYVIERSTSSDQSGPFTWYHLGCLFGAGLITDGRTFYCPRAAGGLDEYRQYASSSPWGTLPQYLAGTTTPIPPNTSNQWLRTIKGYIYWPQSRSLMQSYELPQYGNGLMYPLYAVGFPKPVLKAADLDPAKAIVADIVYHADGSQYMTNAVFMDGSVVYQNVPQAGSGKKLYYDYTQYGGSYDSPAPSDWAQISMAGLMAALHK